MPHIHDFIGKHVHMMGVGGSSMSGLAKLLHKLGYRVSGCDRDDSAKLNVLERAGVETFVGHDPAHMQPPPDLVIYSAAIAPDNPEFMAAVAAGIPRLERAEMLGQLMQEYDAAIGVAGTHGKTSTTSMIAQALYEAGMNPSVHIGGELDALGGSTMLGGTKLFVMEACEFNRSFLRFHPTIAVITNIDADHLDCFPGGIDEIESAFSEYVALVPGHGHCVGWGDDERALRVMRGAACGHVSYGEGYSNDWRPINLSYDERGHARFDAAYRGQIMVHVELSVPGEYNMLNSLAALAVCHLCGADLDACANTLGHFSNAHRRFEHTGTVDGAQLYHDYAHNPAEIKNAVNTAYMQPHGKLFAVWQPHTYSRTKALFNEFLPIFDKADVVLITDIYAAREKDPGDIKTQMLLEPMRQARASRPQSASVVHTPTFDDAEAYLRAHWQAGDLVITLGCGNIYLLNEQIQGNGDNHD